uniref:Uncharacterized protein n=1 Tax=Anguilla anguilla TaxID=7936 RepID=A0A0E9Q523_ANGAN
MMQSGKKKKKKKRRRRRNGAKCLLKWAQKVQI